MKKQRMLAAAMVMALSLTTCLGITAQAESSTEAAQTEAESGTVDIVSVEGGLVRGVESDTDGVQLFKGIPFAGDTSGENRWKAPQPVEPWEGVRTCDSWGDAGMQRPESVLNPVGTAYGDEFYYDADYDPAISENGLNLNVYTPAKSADEKLPVFVWIYGGANNHGNASEIEFNASKLAAKGMVVVCVQYRMGMFGFLTLPGLSEENEHGVSGNYAVLDLVKSLQWVHDYVSGFGGDPDQVTIAGQSAGGYNVGALLRTPLAKGLFQNAIIQSQPFFMPGKDEVVYSSMEEMQEKAEPVVREALGLPEDASSAEIVSELRSHDASYFMHTKSKSNPDEDLFDTITAINGSFAYVLDGYVFTEESVDLTRPGALDGINLLMGCTSNEMGSGAEAGDTMSMDDFAAAMQKAYGSDDYTKYYAPADEEEAYVMNNHASSDRWLGSFRVIANYLNANNEDMNAYTYFFDQNIPSHKDAPNDEIRGCFHSTELWYTLNSMRDEEGQRQWTEKDHELADLISDYYYNFASTGDPNGEGLGEWKVASEENGNPFMWYHEGSGECVTDTDIPGKTALNYDQAQKSLGF